MCACVFEAAQGRSGTSLGTRIDGHALLCGRQSRLVMGQIFVVPPAGLKSSIDENNIIWLLDPPLGSVTGG